MLTAKLVRLDTAWSATPQLSRFPIWRAIRHGVAPLLLTTAAYAPAHRVSDHDSVIRRSSAETG